MTINSAQVAVNEVFALYEKFGAEDYIGEPVSQIEHMCQAAQLAEAEGYDDEIILGAFFHDIGHLCEHVMHVEQMDGYGVVDHEKLGRAFLEQKGFSPKVLTLVESHVQAKRFLTFKYPDYFSRLSEASKKTLEMQGGVMSETEAKAFEADEFHEIYIKLREWDDRAKEINSPLPSLEVYKERALNHLLSQG
jgi:phosphonate degradation associated HDIG domain protein